MEVNVLQTVDVVQQNVVEQRVCKAVNVPKVDINVVQKCVEVPVTLTTETEQPEVKLLTVECTREELVAESVEVAREVPKIINQVVERVVQQPQVVQECVEVC